MLYIVLKRKVKPTQRIKKQRHHFTNKSMYSQSYWFSSTYVQMWKLADEGCVMKNWCFQTVVQEKTLESPLDSKKIKPINPKGNQPWIFFGRTDTEDEALIFWSWDAKSWLIGKDPDVGKDWKKEEKGATEDKMVGQHHRLSGHEFEQTLGGNEGQGSLACCSPWRHNRIRHDLVTELEKEMAPHSSVLAWKIPGTGEPGGLSSMGSHRVGHNWRDLAAAAAFSYSGRQDLLLKVWPTL